MRDEQEQLDQALSHLEHSLRTGELLVACRQLADFSLRLDRCLRREEHAFSFGYQRAHPCAPSPLAKVRGEQASLRRLVAAIANALHQADDRSCLDRIGALRSVLLLHLAKQEWLVPAP